LYFPIIGHILIVKQSIVIISSNYPPNNLYI
jgi:hypothetical protein